MTRFAPLLFALAALGTAATAQERIETAPVETADAFAQAARSATGLPDPLPLVAGIEAADNGVWACASCHGDQGQGTQNVPRLAGLPAGYIAKQLHDYRESTREDGNMRFVADQLSEDEILALALYYEKLDTAPSSRAELGGDLERGRELALRGDWEVDLPSCFSCHGGSGWGVGQSFPPIAGQQPAYTHEQLAAWQGETRRNSPLGLMHSVAGSMSDADMRAVADYLATLPPPQPADTSR